MHFLEGKKQRSLPATVDSLYGTLPLPDLLHGAKGDRESAVAGSSCTEDDLPSMPTAHMETRLLVAVLVSCVVSRSFEKNTYSVLIVPVAGIEAIRNIAVLLMLLRNKHGINKFSNLALSYSVWEIWGSGPRLHLPLHDSRDRPWPKP